MAEDRSRRDKGAAETPATRARAALKDGNFALARVLAKAALNDANGTEPVREEARQVLEATRIDGAPIVVGLVILVVLGLLFAWVITRAHS